MQMLAQSRFFKKYLLCYKKTIPFLSASLVIERKGLQSVCLFDLFFPLDGNHCAQNGCTPSGNHIPVKVEIQAAPTANSLTRNIPTVMTILNGDVPHVRPRIPGGFPVRDSTISITPSDGYYSAGGLQSTQKGKYGNRDMKVELKDLEVEMDRITLGDLLEEG